MTGSSLSAPSAQAPARRTVTALLCLGLLAACGGGGGGVAVTPQAPTVLIRSETTGEVRAPFNVQFFFSTPVTFPSGTLAFSLSGASVVPNSFKQITSDTWQVTLAPNGNQQGLVDLRVPAGAFVDPANGLSNSAAFEFAQPYNTLAPFADLKFGGPVNAFGFITGAGTVTLSFDAVLDAPLAVSSITLSAGTVSAFIKTSGSGQKDVYTFLYTPPPATQGSVTFEIRKGAVTSGGIPNERSWWSFGLATP